MVNWLDGSLVELMLDGSMFLWLNSCEVDDSDE